MSRRSTHDESKESSDSDPDFEALLREAVDDGEVPPIAPLPRPGQIVGEKYRIEERIGRGGMGVVFRATHMVSRKEVALKWMLRAPADEHARRRFVREARVAARIDHPNVVNVFDVDQDGDSYFLVMELLHGQTLGARLDGGVLAVADAVDVLLPALRGAAAAHRSGVVHRDLKPDNIFLCQGKDGSMREAKVLDFGISAISGVEGSASTLTRDGAVLGTPAYMAPEQLQRASAADARTDVYAFGVILYEALAGRVPFDADSYPGLVLAIVQEPPRPLTDRAPNVPAALERVVLRALAKTPADRFSNVEELIDALAPFGTGGTAHEQLSRAPPRSWRLWALVATGVVVALGSLIGALAARGSGAATADASSRTVTSEPGFPPRETEAVRPSSALVVPAVAAIPSAVSDRAARPQTTVAEEIPRSRRERTPRAAPSATIKPEQNPAAASAGLRSGKITVDEL